MPFTSAGNWLYIDVINHMVQDQALMHHEKRRSRGVRPPASSHARNASLQHSERRLGILRGKAIRRGSTPQRNLSGKGEPRPQLRLKSKPKASDEVCPGSGDRGLDALGIDISPVCIETARKRSPEIPFLKMDMARLDLPDASLNGIVSFYSIIHTPKRFIPTLFSELWRVLKPGGILLVVVKRGEDEGYVKRLLDVPVKIWFTHFCEDEIRAYFSDSGFALNRLETRMPYDFEIDVSRIYAEGQKPTGP